MMTSWIPFASPLLAFFLFFFSIFSFSKSISTYYNWVYLWYNCLQPPKLNYHFRKYLTYYEAFELSLLNLHKRWMVTITGKEREKTCSVCTCTRTARESRKDSGILFFQPKKWFHLKIGGRGEKRKVMLLFLSVPFLQANNIKDFSSSLVSSSLCLPSTVISSLQVHRTLVT